MQSESPAFLSYFGDPQATPKQPQPVREYPSEYEITYSFINNTNRPITVVSRLGLPLSVPTTCSSVNNNFIVRVTYFFKHHVKDNVKVLLNAINESSPADLKVLKEAFETTTQSGYRGGESVSIDYEISEETILQMGGSVYHHSVDFVLSVEGVYEAPCHPASAVGLVSLAKHSSTHVRNDVSFGYEIDVIDNTGRHNGFFTNFNNKVWNIPARKDPARQSGIYILSNQESIGDVIISGRRYVQLPLDVEEAIKHGIYPTYADAEALGDVVTQRKKELLDMEYTLKAAQHENSLLKVEQERQLRETERRYKELELERDRKSRQLEAEQEMTTHLMNMEKLRYKDEVDYRATQRKDYSEVLKALPALIVGLGAVYTVVKSMMKK